MPSPLISVLLSSRGAYAHFHACIDSIVILDELDQLITQKQTDIVYRLFEITTMPRSSLILIGILIPSFLRISS